MPLKFVCPYCGIAVDVADEYAGQTGPCVGCRKTVTIPPLAGTPGYESPAGGSSHAWALIVVIALVLIVPLVGCLGLFGFFLARAPMPMGPVMAPAATAKASSCASNLQAISAAMQQYYQKNGNYPPAYSVDKDGKPLHSWRTLLLPYLDPAAAQAVNYELPWDAPENAALLASLSEPVFTCANNVPVNRANYVMIVGPGKISDGKSTIKKEDITDPPGQTILIIEFQTQDIPWYEPRDLDASQIDFTSAQPLSQLVGSSGGTVNAILADGQVVAISDSTPANQLLPLLTIAGGEPNPDVMLMQNMQNQH